MSEEGTIDSIDFTNEGVGESKEDIFETLSGEDSEDSEDSEVSDYFEMDNKKLLHLSTKIDAGVAGYLYDWITDNGGTIGGSAALAMELTRQNKGTYIGWKPNDIDIYFKLDHDIYHDPRRWNDIQFSKKVHKMINDSFNSHFGHKNLNAYYQQKKITFQDSIHESYGNTTRFVNTPPVEDTINMEISVSSFSGSSTFRMNDILMEVIEDINVDNPHKLPGDLYTIGTAYTEGDSRLNHFPQLTLKKGSIVDASLSVRNNSNLFVNSNHRIDVKIRRRLGVPLNGPITSDREGVSAELAEDYIREMESIALLREEANEVAKLAAKQTNTILPERDDSKPQGGFGYTAVQVGIHNSVFGLVPNSHLKLIKRDRLPNIQLIFLYGSLSIPTYIDHYYDFSICKVYIDTEKRNKDENIDAPIDRLHPDVVSSHSLDTPQNYRYSTLAGVISTVTRRFIKYMRRGFIPLQIRDRIIKLKNSNVLKGWTQNIGVYDIITPIYTGFTEFLEDLEFYFLQKIVDIENSKQPLKNKLFSYRVGRHLDLVTYKMMNIGAPIALSPAFFDGFFRGIERMLTRNNLYSEDFSNVRPRLEDDMKKAVKDYYGRLENIFKLYNKLSRDDDLSGILIDMRHDRSSPIDGIQSYTRNYTLRDEQGGEEMEEAIENFLNNHGIGEQEREDANLYGSYRNRYAYVMINLTSRKTEEDMKEIKDLEERLNSRKMGRIQNILDNSFDESYQGEDVKRIQGIDHIHDNISQHFGGGKRKKHKLLKYVYSN